MTTISVITAVWNRANTIGDGLLSLQEQIYPDIEHVIQDSGSTEGIRRCSCGAQFVARHSDYNTTYLIASDYEAIMRWLTRGRLRLAYVPRGAGADARRRRNQPLGLAHSAQEPQRPARTRRHHVGALGVLAAKNLSKVGQSLRRDLTTAMAVSANRVGVRVWLGCEQQPERIEVEAVRVVPGGVPAAVGGKVLGRGAAGGLHEGAEPADQGIHGVRVRTH
ncbi:hypothetical protein [Glycocaulis sp.]|uniref:hypothetical protein n=1 Tax=Glycocaulis sp. TaxID=1969725 RepID=UPI003F71665F